MNELQRDLSKITPILLDRAHKSPKVSKMLAVLENAGVLNHEDGVAVDLGCSGGFFCEGLARHFHRVVGIDIDEAAISFAHKNSKARNVEYIVINSDDIPLPDHSADVIICNHVYEHVPDAGKLFVEISRVLKPEGVCYLGAASRLVVIEPHFKLPFLSWMPKWLAHRYMRAFGKGEFYYEQLRTYWGIRNMVKNYYVDDYTLKIIKDPVRYSAQDMIDPSGFVAKLPVSLLKFIYPFLPSFIFILRKKV
jgi:2-polyprenyl-3-methyl-5-hydroxy-6-metoxy-1,4-benzoquinol methylase